MGTARAALSEGSRELCTVFRVSTRTCVPMLVSILDVHVAGDVGEHEFEVRGVSEARDDRFVSTCHGYEHNIR